MASFRKRSIVLNTVSNRLLLKGATVIATAGFLLPFVRADETPGKALQSRFEAAKESLAAGDLVSAENHYIDAITLGLRQVAQVVGGHCLVRATSKQDG